MHIMCVYIYGVCNHGCLLWYHLSASSLSMVVADALFFSLRHLFLYSHVYFLVCIMLVMIYFCISSLKYYCAFFKNTLGVGFV